MKISSHLFVLGILTMLAGPAHAAISKADEATLKNIAMKQLEKHWVQCRSSWFIGYRYGAPRPTFPPPVNPQPQSAGKGFREAKLSGGRLEPQIIPGRLTAADIANGYQVRAKVQIRMSIVRDYDTSGRFTGKAGQWTEWREAVMPILSIDLEKRNGEWWASNLWLGRVNDVEGLGAKLYRPPCEEIPKGVASTSDLPQPQHKGAVLCTDHATLFEFVDGQCLNGRPCHSKDPQTGAPVNLCASQRVDPIAGTMTTRALPRCDCRRGILLTR